MRMDTVMKMVMTVMTAMTVDPDNIKKLQVKDVNLNNIAGMEEREVSLYLFSFLFLTSFHLIFYPFMSSHFTAPHLIFYVSYTHSPLCPALRPL